MLRLVTLVLFVCGCASGQVLKRSPSEPFWCHTVSSAKLRLRPVDGRNQCERTLDKCQKSRAMAFKVGLKPSECRGQDEAICLRVRFPNERLITLCFADGGECTRVEESLPDEAEVFQCAVESADY